MAKYKTFRTYFKSKPDSVISDAMYTVYTIIIIIITWIVILLLLRCHVCFRYEPWVPNKQCVEVWFLWSDKHEIYLFNKLSICSAIEWNESLGTLSRKCVKYHYFIRFARKRLLLNRQIFEFQLKHQIFEWTNYSSMKHWHLVWKSLYH